MIHTCMYDYKLDQRLDEDHRLVTILYSFKNQDRVAANEFIDKPIIDHFAYDLVLNGFLMTSTLVNGRTSNSCSLKHWTFIRSNKECLILCLLLQVFFTGYRRDLASLKLDSRVIQNIKLIYYLMPPKLPKYTTFEVICSPCPAVSKFSRPLEHNNIKL